MDVHAVSVDDISKTLNVSPQEGLSRAEIPVRLREYGRNIIVGKKKVTLLSLFIRQFKSPFVYLLAAAMVIAAGLGDYSDMYIILVALLLTVVFGFAQEAKAERTLEALQAVIKNKARVVRDGRITEVDATLIVPGDVLVVGEGDRIPTDARLIEVNRLKIDESALTGESALVTKKIEAIKKGAQISDQVNMVFRGTVAASGRGLAIVVRTGSSTEIGKIARTLVELKEEETPLQKKIAHLARVVTLVVGIALVVLVTAGLVRGVPFAELLTTAIAVAVAAIPESLIAVMTVILAVGMTRLLKSKALVRKLVSAETLGSTTVLCVDKTGTLTRGDMSVEGVVGVGGDVDKKTRSLVALIGMTTNEAYFDTKPGETPEIAEIRGDPTETILLRFGRAEGMLEQFEENEKRSIDELPFESDNQYMATLVGESDDVNRLYVKGSPEKILAAATHYHVESGSKKLSENEKQELLEKVEELSGQGHRLLAMGFRDYQKNIRINNDDVPLLHIEQLGDEPLHDIVFVGIVMIADPLRRGVAETVKTAQQAGVRIVMITGDHKKTAQHIAGQIGIIAEDSNVLSGEDLSRMNDEELREVAPHINVYARIIPQDKLRIVRALEQCGESVAMTGDGVNDAPALKQANIGVAMGSGEDVAKEAADVVILDNNFTTIITAIKEGRVILDNLRKVTLYLLKDSFSEIILLGTAIIFGLPLPVLAGQVLWINIVEDGLPSFALSYEPAEKGIMDEPPESRNQPIINKEMAIIIFAVGIFSDILLLGVFLWLDLISKLPIEHIRTVMFAGLALNSLFVIFSLKSLRKPLYRINIFNNIFLVISVVFGVVMLVAAMYIPLLQGLLRTEPLRLSDWAIVVTLALVQVFLIEVVKYIFIHKGEREEVKNPTT